MEENNKEKKGQSVRVLALVLGILAVFVVFGAQLVNWQLVHGAQYRAQADSTNIYTVKKDASRGEILDANGVSLAVNETGYKVVFNNLYVPKGSLNATILQLVALFESRNEEWIDNFPIVVDENGNFAFKQDDGDGTVDSAISLLKSDYRLQQYATAEECINLMASDQWYDCEGYSNSDKRSILAVRYNMAKTGYNNENKYTFAEGISNEMVAIVSENSQKMPGVSVETYSERKYANGSLATNIVGYIGAIDPDTYEEKKDTGDYQLDSKIGIEGIEAALEDKLVGHRGEQLVEVTPNGTIVSETEKTPATSGNTVYLTIDARLQKIALDALKENVEAAQKEESYGSQCTGSVVVLDVNDFSVLCAQSYPNYDLDKYMNDPQYREDLLLNKDGQNAMWNRCFWQGYPIGSAMKPAVALAALQEGVIDTSTQFRCGYTYYNADMPDFHPLCTGTHGYLNVIEALTVSCNIFFYDTGYNLGIDNMNLYQRKLGLGELTGVEIYESDGTLAGPDEKEDWYGGDTIMAAIGQSDNLITPVQLATYAATIANNGTRLRTHVVDKITDYSRQTVLEETQPEVVEENIFDQEVLDIVKGAMRNVVTSPSGTGYYSYGSYEIPIAAKTGTPQTYLPNSNEYDVDNITLIAYAPYDDPQIAIGIIMEHGGKSVYAANVAKAIMDGYFHPETMPEVE